MTMHQTPWYQGFRDGFLNQDKKSFEDDIDQKEYNEGFFDGRTQWHAVTGE